MLELYQAEDCPYCQKVREKLMELGVSYVNHNPRTAENDVRNQQVLEEMVALGGKDQVPFLVDNQRGAQIYESDDIVEYLEEHYG
ncbi:glutathione S-transferase N-terminal domain-containing protein [Natronomonas halophila]|uniref:glutathione S-transferase N-terminal domain-containing protein n=1 Tax=Natronomonas halophila TaxID=2747817 RepID=UPI0015B46444|nr:glutathione S-transferase N-terminal domain-containing protein [Natronomonas halophila]QLD86579.1 glutathione S-transferase N-terminal domain-containing protein [Natronomonas halophila]